MTAHVVVIARSHFLFNVVGVSTLLNVGLLNVWERLLSRYLRERLEYHLFNLDLVYKTLFKFADVHDRIRQAFSAHGYALGTTSSVTAIGSNRWTIVDGTNLFVIRLDNEHLSVSAGRVTSLSQAMLRASELYDHMRYAQLYPLRNAAFVWSAAVRKRFIDPPSVPMVNVGSGRWYEKGWKVLDHSGDWYRYPRWFLDYPFDLTSRQPFPFSDNSTRLIYCEHVCEHFSDEHCTHMFAEMHRSLMPGGGIRIVVPDADLIYDRFRTRDESFFAPWMTRYNATLTEAFVTLFAYRRTPLDESELERNFDALPKREFYNHYSRGLEYDYERAGEHINWFNFEKLAAMLRTAQFGQIYRSGPQESRFPEMRGKNFDTRPSYSLHVDAVK